LLFTLGQAEAAPGDCTAPAYRQLDFWISDWDTFNPDGSGASQARNHVDAILAGCVIHERYEQVDGMTGESFSIYDATRKLWHQSWVTNRGRLLTLEGSFDGTALTLVGSDLNGPGGKRETIKGIWKRQGKGVRETAYVSYDDGKTWQDYFDILFLPHKG
jgi:hypothetical protein